LVQKLQSEDSSVFATQLWRAPLVAVSLAAASGIVADRYLSVHIGAALAVTTVALAAWLVCFVARKQHWPMVFLLAATAGGGAAWHHYRRDVYPVDDVGRFAPAVPHPVLVRGVIEEEPRFSVAQPVAALYSMDRSASTSTVLRVTDFRQSVSWVPVSGRVRLVLAGEITSMHVGDAVEVAGRLSAVQGPANPGEVDQAGYLRDHGIRATPEVRKTPGGITRLERGWPTSFTGCLMAVRSWAQDALIASLQSEQSAAWLPIERRPARLAVEPDDTTGVAQALLLGDGGPMTSADWDKYVRGGVVHILAISGQHLVVLGAFCWSVLRLLGVRQSRGAVMVAVFLLLYAVLTGAHPPAMRSAVTVCAVAAGLLLRRRIFPANTFALAFLTVAILNSTDLFTAGFQLSFVSVAVLYWCTRFWFREEPDPLERLIDESRPLWSRAGHWVGRLVYQSYAVTALMWLVITPLVAARYHVVSPIGFLLGPPLMLLASVALVAAFLLLLAALVWQPLTQLFAPFVYGSLWVCDRTVEIGLSIPGSHFHVGDVPDWWLWVFYGGLLLVLTQPVLRRQWRWAVVGAAGWLCVGLLTANLRVPPDEMRCTFLAVGHGGCTVIETPDGRVLLYDAGAISGPDITRRFIAPFLWSRGIRRIDEVFLSHADLDHFNGLPALLDRFAVGQVSMTPTFADKQTPGVALTLAVLQQRGVPTRILKAGDHLTAGDIQIEVLHPPASGPDGNENARSLVLDVCHAGHRVLLTGDLEGPGLVQLLQMPARPADVLMAPHHGSKVSNQAPLADWAQPRVVVSCQGPPRGVPVLDAVYRPTGAEVIGTWPHGAVTVRSHSTGMVIETHATGQRIVLRSDSAP
jgi:competence protein ComEC